LTVLLSYADLARVAGGPGELEDCLRNIRAAGERAASLTAQLLTFAKKRVGTHGSSTCAKAWLRPRARCGV
jgi:C4-dicarboxylate-specific signal transduction histidine kinase